MAVLPWWARDTSFVRLRDGSWGVRIRRDTFDRRKEHEPLPVTCADGRRVEVFPTVVVHVTQRRNDLHPETSEYGVSRLDFVTARFVEARSADNDARLRRALGALRGN